MNSIKKLMKTIKSRENRMGMAAILVVGIVLGMLLGGGSTDRTVSFDLAENQKSGSHDHAKEQVWTCSMHPQIQQPREGKCPICAMDLIPVESGENRGRKPVLELSEYAVTLAGIQVKPVKKQYVERVIPVLGKIVKDETRLGHISSRVSGRIERLYADYTGIPVNRGDRLVSIYSPALISAQQELIQASKNLRRIRRSSGSVMKGTATRLLQAVRKKLQRWGMTPQQIREIERSEKIRDRLTIYSPMTGIVIRKHSVEGSYVETGTPIYTIVDLSTVWVKLDIYESDFAWIRYGQAVEFEAEAYPGKQLDGKIAFIDPVMNSRSRTVKIRVHLENPGLKLKPGMFLRGRIRSKLTKKGSVMDPDLAGKWISPRHPEIIRERPGKCDHCGMALVRAESLGYAPLDDDEREAPLVVPVSAVLKTGRRAVVYVQKADKKGYFEGRELRLGPRAGDYYIVRDGLDEGEQVVVNGAFKIDSDLQIQAKNSMMNPRSDRTSDHHSNDDTGSDETGSLHEIHIEASKIPKSFRKNVDKLADPYFAIGHELSSDVVGKIESASDQLLKALKGIDMKQLSGKNHEAWERIRKKIRQSAALMARETVLETAREQFELLTDGVRAALLHFGSAEKTIYLFHCPMAFNDKGAFWLQGNQDTRNPYFGSSMLICKDLMEPLYKETDKPSESNEKSDDDCCKKGDH